MKSPAFQYYPKDLLSDAKVMAMSLEEFGAYWRLISVCWIEGGLPHDMDRLAKILHISAKKMAALWPAMEACFVVDGDQLDHPRLLLERERQADNREKKKTAAEKRWKQDHTTSNAPAHAPALQTECLAVASPSASATAQKKKKPPRAALAAPWMGRIRDIHYARYQAEPPSYLVRALRPLVEKYGIDEVAARYERMIATMPGGYYNGWKLGDTWADWGENVAPRGPPPNGKKLSAGEQGFLNAANAAVAVRDRSHD